MFPVWFACGTCRGSFQKLNDFLEHKQQYHFEEFQNTKCIIFEERGILSNDQISALSPTTLKLGEEFHYDDHVNPLKVKVENENNGDRSHPQFQCHTDKTAEFVKIEHQSIDQDFEDNNLDDFIPSKSIAATSNTDCKPSSKTVCLPQNSITKVKNAKVKLQILKKSVDFESTKHFAAPKLNIKSNLSSSQKLIQSRRHNPFVLVRRLTSHEIENCSVSENASCVKSIKETASTISKSDFSGEQYNCIQTRSISLSKPQSVISPSSTKPSKKFKNSFQCKLCLQKFNSEPKLSTHVNSCTLTHPHRHRFCVPCNQKFYKNNNLVKHVLSCHGIEATNCNVSTKVKQCEHCPKAFLYESQLIHHAKTHADGKTKPRRNVSKPFKCQDCGRSFFYKFNLVKNSTSPLGDTKFKCLTPNCKGLFKIERKVLELHPTIHRYEPKWMCSQITCGKKFLTKTNLQIHQYTHSDRRSFLCPKANCEKTYKSKDSIRCHIKSHTERREFHCPNPNCKKSCATKQRLRDHMIVHSNSRPFKCPEKDCAGRYKTKCNLMYHLKAHACAPQSPTVKSNSDFNTRSVSKADAGAPDSSQATQDAFKLPQFKCTKPNCKIQFNRYCELKLHIRTHSDFLRIKCPDADCGNAYKCIGDLRNHMLLHSEARLLKCPLVDCQKIFKCNTILRKHLNTHIGARPFKCQQIDCQKTFKYKINLRKHQMTHSEKT